MQNFAVLNVKDILDILSNCVSSELWYCHWLTETLYWNTAIVVISCTYSFPVGKKGYRAFGDVP